MTPQGSRLLEKLLEAVARAPRSLLMLDYDGTLAAFREDPAKAFPYPGISSVLQQILRSSRTRVVIISGRDANEILPLLRLEPYPEIWGLHGLQRLRTDGSSELSALEPATIAGLAAADKWLVSLGLEHAAEFKVGSIAMHWRGLAEQNILAVREELLRGWGPVAQRTGLVLLEFDGGVEIRAPEADKGDALRTIMNEMDPNIPATYLGDDTTDEHAFKAMNGRGLAILVRPHWRDTAAQLWLKPSDEILDLLTQWLRACNGQRASNIPTTAEVNA